MLAEAQIYGTGKQGEFGRPPNQSYSARPYFNAMVRDAMKNKPTRFDFMKFRILYSQTPQYDPIGEETLAELNEFAYIVVNDADPERVKSALLAYRTVVSNHLAHIDVVLQALSLARQDKRFGKPEFFEWVREGLIRTVVISGSGISLAKAYDIITLQEETILFQRLGVKPERGEPVKEGVTYYNMHDVVNLKNGRKYTIFVNTSVPMRFLEKKAEYEKNFTANIRKQ